MFFGLPNGTQTLTDTLAAQARQAGIAIHLRSDVRSVATTADGARYRLHVGDDADGGDRTLDVDAVVLATPDFVTARLLEHLAPDVASGLAAVDYASVVMVALAVPRAAIGRDLDGSGFLVAQPEGLVLTACSWASSKWAHLDDGDTAILRASAGRADDRRALELGDDELVEALLADLGTTMALDGRPSAIRVTRWLDALPQFRPGHLDRVAEWRAQLATDRPGLVTVGAGIEGLGLPACIRQAWAAAAQLAPA